jgi:anthranilate phosphoribosyltransferase
LDAREALGIVVGGRSLGRDEAESVMKSVMAGEAMPSQLGALVAVLAARGETADEIAGFAAAMRANATRVDGLEDAIDIVGTGGSRVDPFNISTVSSIVAAAAGVRVAKHGNRAASGKCGSADVLEALGVRIDLGPAEITRCVDEAGIAFMFAPRFHPAMRHAGPVRRELGIRTVFNTLGPLANPASVRRLVLGVARPAIGEILARALADLGAEHVLVVHGEEGLDDISPAGTTRMWEVRRGRVTELTLAPEDVGLERGRVEDILSGDAAANAKTARGILAGEHGARRTAVLLNAAAGVYVAGRAGSIREGVGLAAQAIDSGAAHDRLERFVATTQRLAAQMAPA